MTARHALRACRLRAFTAIAAVAAIVAASHAATSQPDAAGPPARIVSLVPALTEMAFAIGAGARVIAVSSYDDFPPEVLSLPKVGALIDPDVERIIALKPDLVLLYSSQTDLMTQLTRASVPYFEYRHGGLDMVTSTITALGTRTGHRDEAARIVAAIERRLSALRQRYDSRPRPRVLLVFGRESGTLRHIYVSGGRGFLHDLVEAAGGANVFADVSAESVQPSTEMILARRPDVIVEIRSAELPDQARQAAEIASWSPLAAVPAVRHGRVHILAGRSIGVPGPRVADSAEQLAAVIHAQP